MIAGNCKQCKLPVRTTPDAKEYDVHCRKPGCAFTKLQLSRSLRGIAEAIKAAHAFGKMFPLTEDEKKQIERSTLGNNPLVGWKDRFKRSAK